ncbi:sigma factor-like helix-turn-helix DNA-binding protein [Streptomyces sp. NPDC005435]|uniref:sigma factor-like helix-turn-helix DNA-binding protein n=1 Tax=Streptomyces sp. NPDC005435 TaxID=3154464 RepID=UPI0034524B3E
MRDRQPVRDAQRDAEFAAFTRQAGVRLLRTATLLTAEPPDACPRARRLLTLALAHLYAHWDRPPGEDPYERARGYLAVRFARGSWYRRARPVGPLAGLTPPERLVLVLRLYEGVGEEQTAALLGLSAERVYRICERATIRLLRPPPLATGCAAARRAPSWARGAGRLS